MNNSFKSLQKFSSAVSKVRNFGVVGSGQMGTGIAIVSSMVAGFPTKVMDTSEAKLGESRKFTESLLEKEVSKNKISSDQRYQVLERISYTTQMADFKDTDYVVEAVNENFDIKKKIFTELDAVLPKTSFLASNTSSISITKLAATTKRPDRFIGLHFMNPVPVMKLIEIVQGIQTSPETLQISLEISEKLGKEVVKSKDYPGFILNRILMPYINEAFTALYEGVATAEDIDKGMKLGTNVPMGPLTLADFIGLDTCLAIMNVLYNDFSDSKYRPCPLLANYVNAGFYGRKSGRGVFEYKKK